jgi:anti-sigma factor RsiW
MKNSICDEISPQLVDYVDGELASEQVPAVEDHLASCAHCRQLVKALDQSLSIAQGLWEGAYQKAGEIPLPKHAPSRTRSWMHYAAAAAVIAVLTGVLWQIPQRPQDAQLSLAQVQEQVHQSARAAQLLVATRMLSECKGTEELVQQQLQYIQTQYSDVPGIHNINTEL